MNAPLRRGKDWPAGYSTASGTHQDSESRTRKPLSSLRGTEGSKPSPSAKLLVCYVLFVTRIATGACCELVASCVQVCAGHSIDAGVTSYARRGVRLSVAGLQP